ncbi:MAG: heavy-metal-associated domain-containing protein [Pseudomonas sp.]
MQLFNVQGMSCGHCVKAVTTAIQQQDPLARVEVNLSTAQVRVESTLEAARIIALLDEAGYDAQTAE